MNLRFCACCSDKESINDLQTKRDTSWWLIITLSEEYIANLQYLLVITSHLFHLLLYSETFSFSRFPIWVRCAHLVSVLVKLLHIHSLLYSSSSISADDENKQRSTHYQTRLFFQSPFYVFLFSSFWLIIKPRYTSKKVASETMIASSYI